MEFSAKRRTASDRAIALPTSDGNGLRSLSALEILYFISHDFIVFSDHFSGGSVDCQLEKDAMAGLWLAVGIALESACPGRNSRPRIWRARNRITLMCTRVLPSTCAICAASMSSA